MSTAATPSRRLWALLALCTLMVVVAAQLSQRWLQGSSSEISAAADCDLTQGCRAEAGSRAVFLQFDQPPASHQRFIATAELAGLEADSVTLDLQGAEMFMGVNRYPLLRGADGRYRGEVQLPACTTGRMAWQARVLLNRGETHTAAIFTFWAE